MIQFALDRLIFIKKSQPSTFFERALTLNNLRVNQNCEEPYIGRDDFFCKS